MFKRTKMYAAGGPVSKGTKYMSKGGVAKGTKYMSKGGVAKGTKYMSKGGVAKGTKYMAKGVEGFVPRRHDHRNTAPFPHVPLRTTAPHKVSEPARAGR